VIPFVFDLFVPWWPAVALAGLFTVYVGVALGVSLFHPDPEYRRHATLILCRLLDAVLPRRSR
jgi:hypothetical protein